MNKDAEKLKGFLFRIIDEHKAACRKHPGCKIRGEYKHKEVA